VKRLTFGLGSYPLFYAEAATAEQGKDKQQKRNRMKAKPERSAPA